MSTLRDPNLSSSERQERERFCYGWREVPYRLADGQLDYDRQPLTLEDVLHPQEGDVMPHFPAHQTDLIYLTDVARLQLANDPSALVLMDTLIFWDNPNIRQHSPDLAVILGVTNPKHNRNSFNVALEGVRPRLIVEVVSPDYRKNDVVTKLDHYFQCRVPFYFIVDREQEEGPIHLMGFRRTRRGYRTIPVDIDGLLWVEPLAIYLGTRDNQVVCYDGDSLDELGDYTQTAVKWQMEQQRADDEKQRADDEKKRADDAIKLLDEERRLREEQATRLDELEQQLRNLQNGPTQD